MRFAVQVKHASSWIVAHAAGAVLVADAFKGYAFLEVNMQRSGRAGVASLFENVDPAIFEALETLYVVGSIGELDAIGALSETYSDSFVWPVSPEGCGPPSPG